MRELILGGVKSGKSQFAENRALNYQLPVTYIATATAEDHAMQERINQHKKQRPAGWNVIEEPIKLAQTLNQLKDDKQCVLIDCLTLWMTNLLIKAESQLSSEIEQLLQSISIYPHPLIMVSNETNMGILPMDSLTRRYCDEIGKLHQQLGQCCERVTLVVAGLPMQIKGDA